jgi:RES domain-containing protein
MAHKPAAVARSDVAFRYANYDTPLWARPNTESGRWHLARSEPTQYLCLSPDGCWADLMRQESLRTEVDVALIRMPLWVLRIDEKRIADYSTFERAQAAGFPPDALIDEDWERCQAEAARLRELGFRGVLSPAAALPGATALTLFGGRRAVDWDDEPCLASAIPAKIVTVGAPPAGLVERVRFRGEEHSGYVSYAVARGGRERRERGQ